MPHRYQRPCPVNCYSPCSTAKLQTAQEVQGSLLSIRAAVPLARWAIGSSFSARRMKPALRRRLEASPLRELLMEDMRTSSSIHLKKLIPEFACIEGNVAATDRTCST